MRPAASIGTPRITRRDLFPLALACLPLQAQRQLPLKAQGQKDAAYLSLADARPVLSDFARELPAGLDPMPSPAAWSQWELARDRETRERLKRGDADSVVNLVLFGTSFTRQPRLVAKQTEAAADESEAAGRLILARVQDLATAVLSSERNDRLRFVAAWLKENGLDRTDPAAEKRIAIVLLENIRRVLREQRAYNQDIDAAKRQGDAGSVFVTRSSLYRDRGLSTDTSFRPNYAIERALGEIQSRGLLGQVRRAAVIGPGLDFADKRDGYDFYPVQTLQPFALIDSVRRLRLAEASGPSVEIFDLSARVLSHVQFAVEKGSPYTMQIPLSQDVRWLKETTEYWERFGAHIGTSAPALNPPPGVKVRMRAVRARPEVVKLLRAADLNVVLQHQTLPEDRRFDLIIATNVLLYYEPFEQALALQSIAAMLSKQGILLSNNALPEVAGVPMHPVGATSVAYSDDPDDGDRVLWYQRK